MFFKLLRIFASNIFSFKGGLSASEKKYKTILRTIFIGLAFLYIFLVYGVMYFFTMISTYNNLKMTGQTELMPVICFIMAFLIVFVLGFLSVANNYYTGNGEEQFLSMPLKATDIFAAKIGVTFITDSLLGMFVLAIGGVIYGYNEKLLLNPSFYVGLLVSIMMVSVTVVYIIYLLLVLVLSLIPVLRKKAILNGIAVFFILIFVFFYSIFSSRVEFSLRSSQNMQNAVLLAGIARLLVDKLPFIGWLSTALTGNWLSILFLLLFTCGVIFGLIPLTAPLYIKTLNGFMDVRTKKLSESQAEAMVKRDVKVASVTKALFFRDVRTVFREPSFFLNGPFSLVLLPVIVLISFCVGMSSGDGLELAALKHNISVFFLSADFAMVEKIKYYIILSGAALSIFLANSTNVASTSFSREGKAFYCLKAMPVQNKSIVFVKLIHAFLYTIIAFIITAVIMMAAESILGLPFSIEENLFIFGSIFVIEIAVSAVLIFTDMFLDAVRPKLEWENPIAAFKQNFNTILSIFITIGVIVLFLLLGIAVLPKNQTGLIIMTVFFALIAVPLGLCCWNYTVKKIDRM